MSKVFKVFKSRKINNAGGNENVLMTRPKRV